MDRCLLTAIIWIVAASAAICTASAANVRTAAYAIDACKALRNISVCVSTFGHTPKSVKVLGKPPWEEDRRLGQISVRA